MKIKLINIRYLIQKRLLLLLMKTFIYLFCTCVFSFTSGNVFSQQKVFIAKNQLVTVDQVFKIIKVQTDYRFIYPKEIFKNAPKVYLEKGEIMVNDLLNRSLSSDNYFFEVSAAQTIIIKSKPTVPNKIVIEKVLEKITGTVSDLRGGLPGVTVTVKGKLVLTVSDELGNFQVDASAGDILIFTSIGYLPVEIVVGTQKEITVVMTVDETGLDEVLINAGYYKVKDKERTGSIAKITAKEIENQPLSNVLATMQGRMAGVNVTQETGVAGGGFSIQIRGINSLRTNGNAPLYVIDGVPYSGDAVGNYLTSFALPGEGSPLNTIDPSDIQSLEVLKDADATAIYGSRGANGVVLITTKKGKVGSTVFNLSSSYAIGTVERMMKLMNTEQYLSMRNQAFLNDGVAPEFYDYDVNGTWSSTRYTDWQKELLGGTSEINSWNASASGGSALTRFLLSGNFRKETTVFPGDSNYKRAGGHLSLDHTSADGKFTAFFSGRYTVQDNQLPGADYTTLARYLAPNAPALYTENGDLNWENSSWENPLAQLERVSLIKTNDLVVNSVLGYNFNTSFGAKVNLGFTDLVNDESQAYPSTVYDPSFQAGSEYSSIYLYNFSRRSWTVEPQLNWKKDFGLSRMDVLAGASFQHQQSSRLLQLAYGFSSNSLLYDLSAANTLFVENNEKPAYKYQAFFGRINYNFDSRYILNLTGRRDGSSRFGPGKQFAYFGAVGAAWLFQKERWLENSSWLSYGKLRASYGTTGNDQIGDYQFLDTYTSSGYSYQGLNGLQPARLFNANFGWETNKKLEVALEAGAFNDRILFSASWYRNRSSNQLVGLPLAATTGFSSLQANLDAVVENSGLEFSLQTVNVKGNALEWSTSFNLTLPKNKLLSFPGLSTSTYSTKYVVGQPITIKKMYHFTGVNPTTGLYEFEDVNGDGQITIQDDRTAIKDFGPAFYGGLQNQLRYRGFELDFLFQFIKQLNYNYAANQSGAGLLRNQPTAYLNSWTQGGDVSAHQLYTAGYNGDALLASSLYEQSDAAVSDASYIRLKNVSLSYVVPKTLLSGLQCKLTLQAQNLLTLTSYQGADPEFTETGFLPPLRIVSGGVQLTF